MQDTCFDSLCRGLLRNYNEVKNSIHTCSTLVKAANLEGGTGYDIPFRIKNFNSWLERKKLEFFKESDDYREALLEAGLDNNCNLECIFKFYYE